MRDEDLEALLAEGTAQLLIYRADKTVNHTTLMLTCKDSERREDSTSTIRTSY